MEAPTARIPHINRTQLVVCPDPERVLFRPFRPSDPQRIVRIVGRVAAMENDEVRSTMAQVFSEFGGRHQRIKDFFQRQYEAVKAHLLTDTRLSEDHQLLLGAFFTHEYSLEAAALFNPSIVPAPDQDGVPPGSLRFIMSLRATGEGHVSSLTFRSGVINEKGSIHLDSVTRWVTAPRTIPNASYKKPLFERKLCELDLLGDFARKSLAELGEEFTLDELKASLDTAAQQAGIRHPENDREIRGILLLARSNYEVQFSPEDNLSARVLFPTSPSESNGIEDARFVLFHNDDGSSTYYATYTAYDGRVALPQLLETPDFLHFRMSTLNGPAVENKGFALFPCKIGGHYVMLARQDNENIFLMYSDMLHFWHNTQVILRPTYPWEMIQLGNCGSPIETDAGWLVITHGVGPMRKYSIGACLLDRNDPSKVIGRLHEPLLAPNEDEREGYVPNVVYSCGALVHNGLLVLPYAMSDYASSVVTVPLKDVINALS